MFKKKKKLVKKKEELDTAERLSLYFFQRIRSGCKSSGASQVVLAVQNLPANVGDRHKRRGFGPWDGKMP